MVRAKGRTGEEKGNSIFPSGKCEDFIETERTNKDSQNIQSVEKERVREKEIARKGQSERDSGKNQRRRKKIDSEKIQRVETERVREKERQRERDSERQRERD